MGILVLADEATSIVTLCMLGHYMNQLQTSVSYEFITKVTWMPIIGYIHTKQHLSTLLPCNFQWTEVGKKELHFAIKPLVPPATKFCTFSSRQGRVHKKDKVNNWGQRQDKTTSFYCHGHVCITQRFPYITVVHNEKSPISPGLDGKWLNR